MGGGGQYEKIGGLHEKNHCIFKWNSPYMQTCPILRWSDLQTDLAYVNFSPESVNYHQP